MRRVVRRGVTRRLRHEGTSCSPSTRLIFINILKGAYVEVRVGRAACWFVRRVVRRGVTRRLLREGTSCSPSARLIFINILKGAQVEVRVGRAACWFVRRVVRRGVTRRLLLDFGSFNFHKHLEGGNRSKCVLVVQRAGSSGALFVVV